MTTSQGRIKEEPWAVQQLAWGSRLSATDGEVGVEHGTVTLTGMISSHFACRAAVGGAWHVAGVVGVIDLLGVRCPRVD